MALEVKYAEIRSTIIPKLQEEFEEMTSIYNEMNATVNGIIENKYMVGEAADSYVVEFTDPIADIFAKLNTNIQNYCAQLENICNEFEKQDSEVSEILGVGK